MSRVAVALAVTSVLAAVTAGCSTPEAVPPVECHGRSTLSSLDPRTGEVAWRAALSQASEDPLLVQGGAVVVSAACGAAVVDLADGDVRYDHASPDALGLNGDVVGVTGGRLFTLDEPPEGGDVSITGIDLDTGRPAYSFSTNTRYQGATVADGSLVTLYGDELAASDQTGTGPSWRVQVPAYGQPRLERRGHLVLVTSDDGSTFAVELADGSLLWRSIPPVAATSYGGPRLTSVPGTVLSAASTHDTHGHAQRSFVYATDARTGRLRWTRRALSVVGADRELTLLSTAGALEAVDTRTGALRWRRPGASIDTYAEGPVAALTRETVVVPQPGDAVLGLDRHTGRARWRGPESGAVVADGDGVVALTPDGVTALDARTGAVRWSVAVERDHQEFAVARDGHVLLLDTDVVQHLGA